MYIEFVLGFCLDPPKTYQVQLYADNIVSVFTSFRRTKLIVSSLYTSKSIVLAQLNSQLGRFPSLKVRRPSVCLSICLSVSLLDYFPEPVSFYSFNGIAYKFDKGIKYKVNNLPYTFLTIGHFFGFFDEFFGVFEIMELHM